MLIVARPLNHNNEGGKAAARDRALISDGSALSYGVFGVAASVILGVSSLSISLGFGALYFFGVRAGETGQCSV